MHAADGSAAFFALGDSKIWDEGYWHEIEDFNGYVRVLRVCDNGSRSVMTGQHCLLVCLHVQDFIQPSEENCERPS